MHTNHLLAHYCKQVLLKPYWDRSQLNPAFSNIANSGKTLTFNCFLVPGAYIASNIMLLWSDHTRNKQL